MQKLDNTYPLRHMSWYKDSRFSNLLQAIDNLKERDTTTSGDVDNREDTKEPLDMIHQKAAQLLYVEEDSIDITRSINEYGIDSMIAAELRNWLLTNFSIDVSLFELLSSKMTIMKLAEQIVASRHEE